MARVVWLVLVLLFIGNSAVANLHILTGMIPEEDFDVKVDDVKVLSETSGPYGVLWYNLECETPCEITVTDTIVQTGANIPSCGIRR